MSAESNSTAMLTSAERSTEAVSGLSSDNGRFTTDAQGQVTDRFEKSQKEAEKAGITKVIRESIWPKKKWVLLERELDWGSPLQKCVCKKQMVLQEDAQDYWETYREEVRRRLNRKRNNVQAAVCDRMAGKSDVLCLFLSS